MAHDTQAQFIRILAEHMPEFFRDARVLEVGSLDLNGSVRRFFSNCAYTGIDVAPGKGVDIVCQGQEFRGPDGSFDHV